MRHRRILLSGLIGTLALVAGVFPASGVAMGAAAATPPFCTGTNPIMATSISSPLKLSNCPIQGRELVMPLGNSHTGAGVRVPPPGHGTANVATTTTGEYELSAVNSGGYLTVRQTGPASQAKAMKPAVAAASDPACSESAYNLEGPFWYSANASPTLLWYYNESTVSRAGLSGSTTLGDIRAGNSNITLGINNCGYAEGTFYIHGSYQGTTSRYANIDSNGNCTSNFPDGQNTVSWGPFTGSAYSANTLAETCYTWSGSYMTEADIYIGSNMGIVDSYPSPCSNKYDLQSVVTHEWGHAFGLAHETSGPDEVMYEIKYACQYRRHLGEGDYIGMNSLYG